MGKSDQRDLYQSDQRDLYQKIVTAKYAKKNKVEEEEVIQVYRASIQFNRRPFFQAFELPSRWKVVDLGRHWLYRVNPRVLRCINASGFGDQLTPLANTNNSITPVPKTGVRTTGIGYRGGDVGNVPVNDVYQWSVGETLGGINRDGYPQRVYDVEGNLDKITQINTLANRGDDREETVAQLIVNGRQWVLDLQSVSSKEELADLQQYQHELREEITQRQYGVRKRGGDSDESRKLELMQRQKAEEHCRPSLNCFSKVSSGTHQQSGSRQLQQPQLSADSSRLCPEVFPTVKRTSILFRHGSSGGGSGGNGGSCGGSGVSGGSGRHLKSKNNQEKRFERRKQFLIALNTGNSGASI